MPQRDSRESSLRAAARRWAAWTVSLFLALVAAAGAGVIARHDITRASVYERARTVRMTIVPARHASEPWNAPVEQSMWLDFEDMPALLVEAVRLREDRAFYAHPGFNPLSTARAAGLALAQGGRASSGASGITQQIAKLLFVGERRSLLRKFEELAVAVALEWLFTKDELIEIYLNIGFFGNQTRGAEAAARRYYGFSFKKTAAQEGRFDAVSAARLAVALSRPTHFNPSRPVPFSRVHGLLKTMRDTGVDGAPDESAGDMVLAAMIATDRWRRAGAESMPRAFSHYRDAAVAEAAAAAPPEFRSAALEAALPYRSVHQLYLEREAARFRRETRSRGDYPRLAAFVVDNQTGGVTAQLGDARRLYPGSLGKPFIMLCALLDGARADTLAEDAPFGPPPAIRNADRRYRGAITLLDALKRSTNTVPARILSERGTDCVDRGFAGLGARNWMAGDGSTRAERLRSMALGAAPVELDALLDSYVALASCGRVRRHAHLDALWRRARPGAVWRRRAEPGSLAPGAAGAVDALHAMMAEVSRSGTAAGVFSTRPIASKTATSDGARQISIATFTDRFTVLVTVWSDAPRRIRRPLSSRDLVGFARRLNANIHIGEPLGRLGCDGSPPPRPAETAAVQSSRSPGAGASP